MEINAIWRIRIYGCSLQLEKLLLINEYEGE